MGDHDSTKLGYPSPPGLSWQVVLFLSIVTLGIFAGIWALVIGIWLKRVRPQSSARSLYLVFGMLGTAVYVSVLIPSLRAQAVWLLLFAVAEWVVATFVLREDLLVHYNGDEPIGLSIGVGGTLFGSIFYIQRYLSEIARIKRTVDVEELE